MIRTLKSLDELQQGREGLKNAGLDFTERRKLGVWPLLYNIRYRTPLPPADFMKSWDVYHSVQVIQANIKDKNTPILDMGCFNSEILYALNRLGYHELHGCDLNPLCRWMPFWNRVRYRLADMTQTPYPSGGFGAITSMSVIEHGVPIEPLVAEVKRLLKPGGLFLFTTDFDATARSHHIDPEFRVFGQSWRIFNREGLEALIDRFRAEGFTPLDPDHFDADHQETPIHWMEQDYTFVFVALKAPAEAKAPNSSR